MGDKSKVSPGQTFKKHWTMVNSGKTAWPEDTLFMFVGGDDLDTAPEPLSGPVNPGQEHVWEMEFVAPQAIGQYNSFFRMVTGNNNRFGHKVWVNILVVEEEKSAFAEAVEQQSAPMEIDSQQDKEGGEDPKPAQHITPKMIYDAKVQQTFANPGQPSCSEVVNRDAFTELFDFGFVDFEKNYDLLKSHNFDVQTVAHLLCEANQEE